MGRRRLQRHTCASCGREFESPRALRRHLLDHHGPQQRCPLCSYECPQNSLYRLWRHLQETHHLHGDQLQDMRIMIQLVVASDRSLARTERASPPTGASPWGPAGAEPA